MTDQARLRFFGEVLGLHPLPERLRQARIAIAGEQDVPGSKFGLSSLSQLRPRVALPLWSGRPYLERHVLISNLYNHRQPPIMEGWSVRKTDVEDFRGRDLTYDSHNGTDFAMPVGSTVVTAAPGQVVRIASEYNRGGLKIFIDHGAGLMTCYAHLARPLVRVGQAVDRGQPIARSGYSGIDALITFPLGVPHVHFNVWLNGEPVDPFPHHGQPSLWAAGDHPAPAPVDAAEGFEPSRYSESRLADGIAACITASSRERIAAIDALPLRAAALLAELNYYPTRFPERIHPYAEEHERAPRLDAPVSAEHFDAARFVDDLG